MAVLFLNVAMIRGRRTWVVVRASDLVMPLRRPLALMRMIVMRPPAAAAKARARRIDRSRCGRAYSLTTLSALRS